MRSGGALCVRGSHATFSCGGQTFTAKGRHVLSLGWKDIDRIFRASLKEEPEDEAESDPLPDFTEGQLLTG